MLSFWEKESFINFDYIIIGSGIVGLSTAISIKEKQPNSSVLILEKGTLPTGASTKNAGFACFGSLTEILYDLETTGEEETLHLIEKRYSGLQKLRQRLGDSIIDFQNNSGYELLHKNNIHKKEEIEKVNSLIKPFFKQKVFVSSDEKINEFQFNSDHVIGMVENKLEGQINTGKMMSSLWDYANSLSIKIITNCEVITIEDCDNIVDIHTTNHNFKAGKVAICTNAFTKQLIPSIKLSPGRGQVLITKPIPKLPFKGVFHMDEGYYYFRNFENRILFGGGRNLDFELEATTTFEINNHIINVLKEKLDTIIIPYQKYEVEQTWTGIMAFGENKTPIVKHHSENIILGIRLNGMGVAIGSQLGYEISRIITQ